MLEAGHVQFMLYLNTSQPSEHPRNQGGKLEMYNFIISRQVASSASNRRCEIHHSVADLGVYS